MGSPPPGYPPYQQHGERRKSSHCCLKCICCFYCFLLIFIIILAGVTYYLFMEYKPEIPSYKVKSMDIKSFTADQKDFSINVDIIVYAEANNPNSHISFKYGDDSAVSVSYKNTTLCSGKLPSFEQGTKNITIMEIDMTGKNQFGPDLQDALQENQKTGKIPLLVNVKAPVSVVLGSIQMREFTVHVKCYLVIDSMSPGTKPRIVSSSYDIDASF